MRMLKRKEFIVSAAMGLTLVAGATAAGVIDWPAARAEPVAGATGRLTPNAGAPGVAFAPPQGAPLSFAEIFEQVAPAVVQIDVTTRVQRPQGGMIQIPGLPGFAIPNPNGGEDDGEGQRGQGAGSGFFISADGYIVTNNHVVENAEEITVRLADERELTARIVGRDESTDLAVLKVEGRDFPFVTFEEQAQPRVGDWVIAVGNPFGLGGSASAGIVSATSGRSIDRNTPFTDYLQIDAAINRGNSGGPTFDIYGRVIGVNSAIYSPTGGSVGIGFAIPAGVAKPITDRLMRGETIQRGYLGATVGPVTRDIQQGLSLPNRQGAFIADVVPGGPADQAGLQAEDVVTTLNGRPVADGSALTMAVGATRPGDELRLEVIREGRRRNLTARAGTRPSETELNASGGREEQQAPSRGGADVGGLSVAPMSDGLRQRYNIPGRVDGVVVVAAGQGRTRGFQPGFVISRANNRPVRTVEELEAAVQATRAAGRESVFLTVWTPQGNASVMLELPPAR